MLLLLVVYYKYSITTKQRFFNQKSNYIAKKSSNLRLLVDIYRSIYVKVK